MKSKLQESFDDAVTEARIRNLQKQLASAEAKIKKLEKRGGYTVKDMVKHRQAGVQMVEDQLLHLKVVTTGRGTYKAGLKGMIIGGGEKTVFLGPDNNVKETRLPIFTLELENPTSSRPIILENAEYSRDFVFANSEEGKKILGT
jgi:hypothetical protein